MRDNREKKPERIDQIEVLEVRGSVLILPLREAIFFLILFVIFQLTFLGVTAFRFDRLEKNIKNKWQELSMHDRGQDIERAQLSDDLSEVVKLTVGMWGKYFEETKPDDNSEDR